jgi:hypothetical protein
MLLRSNVEFSKRVFLDRLTCDNGQPLVQPADIDAGPGDLYEYGGCFDAFNFGTGADCSGCVGIVTAAALNGTAMQWQRYFSTETFPNGFHNFQQVSQQACINSKSPIKVMIMHGGGGPNSHMACQIDGWDMESNGDFGVCTDPPEITGLTSDYWNDWWISTDTISEDTTYRTPRTYPLGLDYAGGRIAGADLKAAGVAFVCRYLSDGGTSLPNKQLQPAEAADLMANGIEIVSNWETNAQMMLGGYQQGITDANAARAQQVACGGPPGATVYFSADFDAAPTQQTAINQYLQGCCDALGGPGHVGIYGSYYVGMRALNAGVCSYFWQTEAWSGGSVDSRVAIIQRNQVGYKTVSGVQCDINEAHADDIGQWHNYVITPPAPSPVPDPGGPPDYAVLAYEQLAGPRGLNGYGVGWSQLNGHTLVDAIAEIGQHLGLAGYAPPVPPATPPPAPPAPPSPAVSTRRGRPPAKKTPAKKTAARGTRK